MGSFRFGACLTLVLVLVFSMTQGAPAASEQLPAFPGAEGFGAMVSGGRGGRVITVTNLNSDGPGSLQFAVNQQEPRIVVFAVSGEIIGDLVIPRGDLTIAGQTAPGGGITIRGRLVSRYEKGIDNIIIRHIRVRPPPAMTPDDAERHDAVTFSLNQRFIFDHLSVSWGIDETVDIYEARDATVQWSTIEESSIVGHPKGPHNNGLINGPNGRRVSVHHNLFVGHKDRSPAIASGPAEVINNLVYNSRKGFHHVNPARGEFQIVGNYYRRGPSSELIPMDIDFEGAPGVGLSYYIADLCIDDPDDFSGVIRRPAQPPFAHSSFANRLQNLFRGGVFVMATPFDFSIRNREYRAVTVDPCDAAANLVLARSGAFPRDTVTTRSISEVRGRSGSWGVDEPGDLMAGLMAVAPPEDRDKDGMADGWERTRGLDPLRGDDHSRIMESGYTAIEEYINELADSLVAGVEIVPLPALPGSVGGDGSGSSDAGGGRAAGPVQGDNQVTIPASQPSATPSFLPFVAAFAVFFLCVSGYIVISLRKRSHGRGR